MPVGSKVFGPGHMTQEAACQDGDNEPVCDGLMDCCKCDN